MLKFIKHEKLLLQRHPELNEKWVQDRIAEDPSILGLGDVVLKDKERLQPRAGRLDLLLQDPDSLRRYEVEIQLCPLRTALTSCASCSVDECRSLLRTRLRPHTRRYDAVTSVT